MLDLFLWLENIREEDTCFSFSGAVRETFSDSSFAHISMSAFLALGLSGYGSWLEFISLFGVCLLGVLAILYEALAFNYVQAAAGLFLAPCTVRVLSLQPLGAYFIILWLAYQRKKRKKKN